jgi:hypothetical protein
LAVPIKASWKFDRLACVRQQIPVNFSYSVTIDGRDMGTKTDTATVHSVNDCLLGCRYDAGKWHMLPRLFAAYVNEDHPQIDRLLKDALTTGVVGAFDGYQRKDPKQVFLQVFAIWEALHSRGIQYSNITDVPAVSSFTQAQHIRFLDESFGNAQANCVDGSVLFASILQKIGLDPALIVIPGHMFVLCYASPGRKDAIPLETTLLGSADVADNPHSRVTDLLGPRWREKTSAKVFGAAVDTGVEELNKLSGALKRQGDDHSDELVGAVINISDARKAGIMPIPYEPTTKSAPVSFDKIITVEADTSEIYSFSVPADKAPGWLQGHWDIQGKSAGIAGAHDDTLVNYVLRDPNGKVIARMDHPISGDFSINCDVPGVYKFVFNNAGIIRESSRIVTLRGTYFQD